MKETRPIVVVHPSFVLSDWWLANRLGKRAKNVYVFRSLKEGGLTLAGSLDYLVEFINQWEEIYALTTRGKRAAMDYSAGETLSLGEAISLYTLGDSTASIEGADSGSISAGEFADLVVLDNFAKFDLKCLKHIEVYRTFVTGKLVYLKRR